MGFFIIVLVLTGCAESPAQPETRNEGSVITGVSYEKEKEDLSSPQQTLDLYLPPSGEERPPLLVFIHGTVGSTSEEALKRAISLAELLASKGAAVALVRTRPPPERRHPAQVEDVAAAVAFLFREADRYGYDRRRLFLAGHSSGAQLASLVALDDRYLAAHAMAPSSLTGVIGMSGIYDLSDRNGLSAEHAKWVEDVFGSEPATLRDVSPLTHVSSAAPPFLLMSGSGDSSSSTVGMRRFGKALNDAGEQKTVPMVISERDHLSILTLSGEENMARELLLDFLNLEPLPAHLAELVEAKRSWLDTPLSTTPFWEYGNLIRSYPIDQRFLYHIASHFGPLRHELIQWPLEEFHAIDLLSLLERLPAERTGKGDYLMLTNIRNEKQVWSKKEIAPHKPVLVVGIDDERNLFEMAVFYRMRREYSWKVGPEPPTMARPLGAFVYFLEPPPPEYGPQAWHFGITEKSFRLFPKNPLAPLRTLPDGIYQVLTSKNGCVYCHSYRGIGSRSHHILASNGAAHGGFALALEDYPPEVFEAFVFKQREVAGKMGATPNVVEENVRRPLSELVANDREKGQDKKSY